MTLTNVELKTLFLVGLSKIHNLKVFISSCLLFQTIFNRFVNFLDLIFRNNAFWYNTINQIVQSSVIPDIIVIFIIVQIYLILRTNHIC